MKPCEPDWMCGEQSKQSLKTPLHLPTHVTQESLSQQWDRFILSEISSLLAMFSKYATWEEGHILEGPGDL